MKRIILAVALFLWSGASWAATITVTTTLDQNDGAPPCSLREAILSANADSNQGGCSGSGGYGNDTIILPGGPAYVLTRANAVDDEDVNDTGDLDITDDVGSTTVTGDGPGTTIVDANDIDRVFEITSGAVVTISGVTIRNGTPDSDTGCGDGGGIENDGNLTLTNVVVTQNDTGPGFCRGGGISNTGIFDIDESTISNNNAGETGGGINDTSGDETQSITNSTISGNDAAGEGGGGIYMDAADTITTIVDTTISGNTTNGHGGGIYIFYGLINLRNVTVTNNRADNDADLTGDGGGIALPDAGVNDFTFRNTIIAGNFDDSASGTIFPDCFWDFSGFSTFVSEGFNLLGDNTGCGTPEFTGIAGDQVGDVAGGGSAINPRLGPLADNGGPTFTHVLLTTPVVSPAIDTANSAGCFTNDANSSGSLTRDQRNSPRPQDGGPAGPSPARCDIGAFELGGCGDGFLDPSEACDDGNIVGGDGCSAICEIEACGNDTLDVGEECDDGNTADGDGCSANCTNEVLPACGDDILQSDEECDDGNTTDGDGCSATCLIEPACGDGTVDEGEGCDDGNTVAGDGCSSTCSVEPPPVFRLLLGDGGCSLIPEGGARFKK